MCVARSVVKTKEVEFPVPMSVYEVIFSPQPNTETPNFTPPEVRLEYQVRGVYEQAFLGYLKQYETVSCSSTPPPPDSCFAGPVQVNAPAFDPATLEAAEPSGPTGCAKIDAGAVQPDNVPVNAPPSFKESLLFEQGLVTPTAESLKLIDQFAEELNARPGIECVSVVGSVTLGEPQLLASQRAQAVRAALVQRGVDAGRLNVLTASVALGTDGPRQEVPSDRRVILRVVLESPAK